MSTPAVAVATYGLTKHFGDVHAVEDLDVTVRRGEVYGFLGPNGAGKSTTMRLLLDFIRPTRGRSEMLGGSGADPAVRARVGYLPGDLFLDPAYTATELFDFYGALRGGVPEPRVGELCERFHLDPHRPVGELSSGNRRKIGVVQAFMHDPELLVLDEPTSGLDPLLQHEFQRLVGERVAAGATVLLSSHVLPEVERMADRVGILREGRLVTETGVAELQARARQRIEVFVNEAVEPERLRDVPGVVEVVATPLGGGCVLHVAVEGSQDAFLKAVALLPVERIITHEVELEEVFLDLYRGQVEP